MTMEFNLKVDGKYIVKTGLPFYYEGRSFDNSTYFSCGKFYEKTIIFIREIIHLSPLFTKISFQKYRRENRVLINLGAALDVDRYEEFSLPYFVIYDDSNLEIPQEIQATIASITGKGVESFMRHSKFIESIFEYDPVLNERITQAERMIQNADNVKARQLQKIDRIYSEFIHEKKAFNKYDERLKFLFEDDKLNHLFGELDVIQKKLDANPSNEPDSGLGKEQHEQS